jgi:orotate phosphoribosyltransferase
MGAITLAHDLARNLSYARGTACLRAYTEQSTDDLGRKSMVFKKTSVRPSEHVLLVEDVLTTGSSIELCAYAVGEKFGRILPFVGALVNRSGLSDIRGRKIVALIDHPMPTWEAHECPLCKQGSEAIRPKLNDNWQQLNAAY